MKVYLVKTKDLCNVTKKVFENFNSMSDKEFMMKYACSKTKYLKRVMRYGDPYMNAPLAKFGKFLARLK